MATTNLKTNFVGMLTQYAKPRKGFATYFTSRPGDISDALLVEFHKLSSYRYTSKARTRGSQGDVNDAQVWKKVTEEPPKYIEKMPFVLSDYDRSAIGQTEYDKAQRQVTMMSKLASDMSILMDKITRAECLQASKIFQTGGIPFKTDLMGVGVDDVSFDVPSTNFEALANSGDELYWDNASAKIWANIESRCRRVATNSGGTSWVKDLVFGESAFNELMSNTAFMDKFNKLKLTVGEIDLKEADENGFALFGKVVFAGHTVRLMTLIEDYIDPADNSTLKPYINTNNVVFIGSGDYRIHHAGVDVIKDIGMGAFSSFIPANGNIKSIGAREASSLYVRTFTDENASSVFLEASKFPLYIPHTSNTFGCMKVLA